MSNTTKSNGNRMGNKNKKKRASSETTASKRTNGREAKAAKKDERGIPMAKEVQLVASFGVMVILMLSNFGWCGTAGVWLSSFFFGIFGCVQYVMPLAFFLMVTILLANEYSNLAIKKCAAGFVCLTMVSAFAQIVYQEEVKAFYDLFAEAVKDHSAGGMLGGGIALLLKSWFGTPGAIVIIGCVMLLSLVMVTQKSFVGFFRDLTQKGQHMWKENRQKMSRTKKEKGSLAERLRVQQCEKKIKEIEEEKEQSAAGAKTKKSEAKQTWKASLKKQPEIKIHIPLFTDEDEIKKKDNVQELHPQIYPFTREDMETKEFDGKLDFSAFSFQGGRNQEELEIEMKEASFKEAVSEITRKEREQYITDVEIPEETPEEGRSRTPRLPEEITAAGEVPVLPVEQPALFEEEGEEEEIGHEHKDGLPEIIIPQPGSTEAESLEVTGEPEPAEPEPEPQKPVLDEKEPAVTKDSDTGETLVLEGDDDADGMDGWEAMQAEQREEKKKTELAVPKAVDDAAKNNMYVFPPVSLLALKKHTLAPDYDKQLKETARKLQATLESFGVRVTITDISCGPSVTRYEMFPEQGTKVSKILSLTDDIKLNLAATDIRIEAPIPGKAAIGIEVPNKENQTVHFRELVDNRVFKGFKSRLAFAVGKDIGGKIVVADLAKMPHLLIAGATGSGKSVCINTLIMSILYKASPTEVKLIMIDPKMVELSTYNGIPHLLIPVVTDPKKASGALNWAVAEMTDRYKKFTECSVRNIEGYNKKVEELVSSGEIEEGKLDKMPQIVIIIDELADLMMVAPGEVEDAIVRLSQLARAAGIHLVIATQRPSVNVITGLIKANVPSRIAFSVSSGVDSRTIIDMNGAEKLLGKGDMLFYPSGYQKPVRVQGAFISDAEVGRVVEFLKENESVAVYDATVSEKIENKIKSNSTTGMRDEYFEAAARFIMEKDKATIGMLQRMFKIGFNRAARIIDQLAEAGIVGPDEGTKPRKILMSPEQLDAYFEENL